MRVLRPWVGNAAIWIMGVEVITMAQALNELREELLGLA